MDEKPEGDVAAQEQLADPYDDAEAADDTEAAAEPDTDFDPSTIIEANPADVADQHTTVHPADEEPWR